ncbi:efflux RND transporter permease subunit [Aneurinibacillus terranovensis]|uniref:efflux RND transporter permease subunit n=1 Tax=Aneurinibacillus terranovensis TaxID=278991 RepID=UPI00041CD20E|nr:efflux RND transporter permease subunit [Aneurinibacillus terranovensis]
MSEEQQKPKQRLGIAGQIARVFIDSKLTPLLVVAILLLGVFAVMNTPREEEPQIKVPMMDVYIPYPGATAADVENRVTKIMEKKLWKVDGIEYIYSTSKPGMAMFTARFYVGKDLDQSLVRLYNALMSNMDELPQGTMQPIVKPVTIDDVPIVSVTLWSKQLNDYALHRIGTVVSDEVNKINNIAKTNVIGGRNREVRIQFDPKRLAAYHLSPVTVETTLQQTNLSLPAGTFDKEDINNQVKAGRYLLSKEEIENLVIGVYQNRPVYVKDIATIIDGPGEISQYVLFGPGPQAKDKGVNETIGTTYPAITIQVSKKPGTNAVAIAKNVIQKIDDLKGKVIPDDVHVTVTRNYGDTAEEKANELIIHLLIATFSVVLLIGVSLGIREAVVIGITVPVTLALALFLSDMYGYTLNRVTLFALIFAIGILVDDAIVVVENMHRWFQKGTHPPLAASVLAVNEVGNPTILATITVIATLMPMAFVGGLMGPYMAPIPINASVAMFFSLFVAFIITPWFAYRLLKKSGGTHPLKEISFSFDTLRGGSRWYARFIRGLLLNKGKRALFLGSIVVLLLGSMLFFYTKAVPMKMMPFDNKSEFQVVVDMPEGTTLEDTAKATKALGDYLAHVNEVTDYEMYIGTASPFNFNGLVRHYYLRTGPNVADIQVNLVHKQLRQQQSHDVAKRIRPYLDAIAAKYGANIKVVEVPPGPPVMSTIVLEVYGNNKEDQYDITKQAEKIFRETKGVVDVDTYMEANQPEYRFTINDKGRLNGITEQSFVKTMQMVLQGSEVGLLHPPNELDPVVIRVQPPKGDRSSLELLKSIQIPTPSGQLIPLGEIATIEKGAVEQTLYRKNLQSVMYVVGDVAGYEESPAYSIANMWDRIGALKTKSGKKVTQYITQQPWLEDGVSVKWDGESQITYEVFRDLGIAFGVALIIMYLLIVGWFQSFVTPLIIMSPIPLTLIGVIPGHWIFGAFFTATSMIGVIALAGIIVRNSILLVEFAIQRRKEGAVLTEAVIEAGIVRAKPIILTAAAVVVGGFVILFDPIFQGLAISLMFGTITSTILTLFVIPVVYAMVETKRAQRKQKPCQIECADDVLGM